MCEPSTADVTFHDDCLVRSSADILAAKQMVSQQWYSGEDEGVKAGDKSVNLTSTSSRKNDRLGTSPLSSGTLSPDI